MCNPDYKNRSLIVPHLAVRSGNLGSLRSIVINLFANIFHALCPISFGGIAVRSPNPQDTPHPADVSVHALSVALTLRVEKSTISVPRINQLEGEGEELKQRIFLHFYLFRENCGCPVFICA